MHVTREVEEYQALLHHDVQASLNSKQLKPSPLMLPNMCWSLHYYIFQSDHNNWLTREKQQAYIVNKIQRPPVYLLPGCTMRP